MRFEDRHHAGQVLGAHVVDRRPTEPVVYALPRGGVPVGFEVARSLDCPLDVLLVRKIGVPRQPELAMGAIGEDGVVVRNEAVLTAAGVTESEFEAVMASEKGELERRATAYRAGAPPVDPGGATAIVVDDGLATGSTARAAIEVLRRRGPEQVWLAVPVAPRGTTDDLAVLCDQVVVSSTPRWFEAVGSWYRDFTQVTDGEVEDLLRRSRLA